MAKIIKAQNQTEDSTISLDSAKIRIPMERVKILNDSLLSHWIPMEMNESTGEIRETNSTEFKGKAYYHKGKGISTRVAIEKQVTKDKTSKDFLTIGINAKMLKGKYLEGITPLNVLEVYRYLQDLDLFTFSENDFLRGECTDVDYKKDFQCEDVSELVLKLRILTIPSPRKDKGYKTYDKPDNKGIEWSHRKTTAFQSTPFVKVYDKHLDLKYHSKDFREAHISDQETQGKTRAEYTIKNRKHFRAYEIENTTLSNLIDLPQPKLEEMLSMSIKKHIERPTRTRDKSEGLNPNEQELVNLIHFLQLNRVGLNEAKRNLYLHLHPKTKKRREVEFDRIWNEHFSKLPQTNNVNDLEKWLNNVGVQFL